MLRKLGYDVEYIAESGLRGCEDDEVVKRAVEENRIIVTHDLGFGYIYYFSKRGRVGIIVLRIHPPTVEETDRVLRRFVEKVDLEKENLTKCLIMLNRRRYRVLR